MLCLASFWLADLFWWIMWVTEAWWEVTLLHMLHGPRNAKVNSRCQTLLASCVRWATPWMNERAAVSGTRGSWSTAWRIRIYGDRRAAPVDSWGRRGCLTQSAKAEPHISQPSGDAVWRRRQTVADGDGGTADGLETPACHWWCHVGWSSDK